MVEGQGGGLVPIPIPGRRPSLVSVSQSGANVAHG